MDQNDASETEKTCCPLWSKVCELSDTFRIFMIVIFGPIWFVKFYFLDSRNLSPANCIILEVLQIDRYNVSVIPLNQSLVPYTTITETTKEGFKNYQQGQKLNCYFSEDYRHGYFKWQVQFHSEAKDIPFTQWFSPMLFFPIGIFIYFYISAYECLKSCTARLKTEETRGRPPPSCCPPWWRLVQGSIIVSVCTLLYICFSISMFLYAFVATENLGEANCLVLNVLENDRYKVSVVPVVSIIEPFNTSETMAEEGFNDFKKGQKLRCYYSMNCVMSEEADEFALISDQCVVQFHSNQIDTKWDNILAVVCVVLLLGVWTYFIIVRTRKYYFVRDKEKEDNLHCDESSTRELPARNITV